MDEDANNWYVIHTYSGHEERVKKNLEQRIKLIDFGDKISQIIVPAEEEVEVELKPGFDLGLVEPAPLLEQ